MVLSIPCIKFNVIEMKIIEIIPSLSSGGAERFVVDLCNSLSKKNDVILVVLYKIDSSSIFARELHSTVKVVNYNKKAGLDLNLFISLTRLIKKENPQIVHTHNNAIVYCSLSALLRAKTQFIHTVHSDAFKEQCDRIGGIVRRFMFTRHKIHPISISEESRQSFIECYGVTPAMIYNGRPNFLCSDNCNLKVVEEKVNSTKNYNDSIVLINVARINEAKNQLNLVKAINALNNRGLHFELIILGRNCDDQIYDSIKKNESRYIHLFGEHPNPRLFLIFADAFCLSSVYEGMPITLIESFSVGTIPICTPVGGILNMIDDNKNGLLAKGSSQSDIEDVLIRFHEMSNEKKNAIKKNAKKSFELYDMETCGSTYLKLMEELCNN